MRQLTAGVVIGALLLVPIMILTAMGARRRGQRFVLAVAAGIFFPVTWTVWYLRDEHPYRRTPRHTP